MSAGASAVGRWSVEAIDRNALANLGWENAEEHA